MSDQQIVFEPGNATDVLVRSSFTVRERHANFRVMRSPEAPDYWFANCLILDEEPSPESYPLWLAEHAKIFAGVPLKRRVVIWETAHRNGLAPYTGLITRECTTVFILQTLAERRRVDAVIRPIQSDDDWQLSGDLQIAELIASGLEAQATFERWRFGIYRRDALAGRCRCWGAWIEGRLVSFAGLYFDNSWARFISPITAPAYRRRGLFAAIAGTGIRAIRATHPQTTIVVVAQTGAYTENVYERLGFAAVGQQHALSAAL